MTLEITHGFPQDVWNETLSHCDFSTLKACCYISKTFTDIVETSSVYILERFHLDNAENGKIAFRRIVSLGNLFQEWTNKASLPEDSMPPLEDWKLFNDYLLIGINPFNYLTLSTRAGKIQCEIAQHLYMLSIQELQKSPLPSSIREILAFTSNHIRKDDNTGLAIRTIVYMTPHDELRDHPAKKDLIDLFANNLNDLPLLLNYNPKRTDALLNQDFSNLANDHMQTLILSYLCNHDIKRVQKLLSLIKEKEWTFNADLAKAKPGLQKILTSSYDDKLSPFLELLLLYKDEIEQITNKTLVSHVCTSGNALLLKKLRDDYKINLAGDLSCFHYASNREVAQILFESGANINSIANLYNPLAIALMFDKPEVAAFLIEKNANLYDIIPKNPLSYTTNPNTFQLMVKKVNTFSLIGFLLPRSLKEIGQNKMFTWIALKELAIRVAKMATLAFTIYAIIIGIPALAYPGSFYTISNITHISIIGFTTMAGLFHPASNSQYKY